jgi:hypothetical protein
MERRATRLITFLQIGDGIQVYLMSDLSEGLIETSDHFLVVTKVIERLAVSKRMVKKMDVERFNLKQLNEEEVNPLKTKLV